MVIKNQNRIIELDIFRGLAAILVVLFHFTARYDTIFETDTMKWFEFSYGHYGVQLFFIISGFVIFMTLERCKSSLEFIKRRFIRLYPTFWICMVITFIITSIAGITRFERTPIDFVANITMLPNLLGYKAIDGVYWSLEVELLFYFFMIILLQFKLLKYVFAILLLWLFSGILIHYFHIPYLHVILITGHNYLFISGISFYKIWKNREGEVLHYHFLLVICLIYGFTKDLEEGSIVTICFALFYLFIYGKLNFMKSLKMIKLFVFLGDISYALYLIHQFIGMIIIFYLSRYVDNYFILLIVPLMVSISLAWLVTDVLEKRIQQKLKKMLFLK